MINTTMKINEAEAVLGYLEFHLLKFVEETERHIADPDVVGNLYNRAYDILRDFEVTLDTQVHLTTQIPLSKRGS